MSIHFNRIFMGVTLPLFLLTFETIPRARGEDNPLDNDASSRIVKALRAIRLSTLTSAKSGEFTAIFSSKSTAPAAKEAATIIEVAPHKLNSVFLEGFCFSTEFDSVDGGAPGNFSIDRGQRRLIFTPVHKGAPPWLLLETIPQQVHAVEILPSHWTYHNLFALPGLFPDDTSFFDSLPGLKPEITTEGTKVRIVLDNQKLGVQAPQSNHTVAKFAFDLDRGGALVEMKIEMQHSVNGQPSVSTIEYVSEWVMREGIAVPTKRVAKQEENKDGKPFSSSESQITFSDWKFRDVPLEEFAITRLDIPRGTDFRDEIARRDLLYDPTMAINFGEKPKIPSP